MKSLYNPKDVAKVRDQLLLSQYRKCKLTDIYIGDKDAVLDHDHSSQFVRAVLHRQSNAALGKLENIYKRYLKHWYPGTLSDFLRQAASYIETDHPKEYFHPGWKAKVVAEFNKLNSKQQVELLTRMYKAVQSDIPVDKKSNNIIRKAQFKKLILNRSLGYDIISHMIQQIKDYT